MSKMHAIAFIRSSAIQKVEKGDQDRFIEIIEKEIQSIHEGSVARYRLSLAQFKAWLKSWNT